MNLYWELRGKIYELEAETKGGKYAWYRNLQTDESMLLPVKMMKPVADEVVLAMAQAELS